MGANATLFLGKGCQFEKRLGTFALKPRDAEARKFYRFRFHIGI